jgi:hydrogenase nickel incorporation protein HypA/HybF
MHEAVLMKNLLSIVDSTSRREGAGPVRVVHLRIGEMAGVNADALQFAFDVMAKDSTAADAVLEIEKVPLSIRCRTCGAEARPEDFVFVCGVCGSGEIEILTGREMEVDYIVAGEDTAHAGEAAGGE